MSMHDSLSSVSVFVNVHVSLHQDQAKAGWSVVYIQSNVFPFTKIWLIFCVYTKQCVSLHQDLAKAGWSFVCIQSNAFPFTKIWPRLASLLCVYKAMCFPSPRSGEVMMLASCVLTQSHGWEISGYSLISGFT